MDHFPPIFHTHFVTFYYSPLETTPPSSLANVSLLYKQSQNTKTDPARKDRQMERQFVEVVPFLQI